MSIRVRCEECDHGFRAPDKYAGKRVGCPECGEPVRIPKPVARSESPALPPRVTGVKPPKKRVVPAAVPVETESNVGRAGRHAYWFLLLALVPLTIATIWPDDIAARFKSTVDEHPEAKAAVDEAAFFAALPGGRIEGALFARKTSMHMVLATVSFGAYLGLFLWFARGSTGPTTLITIAFFTGLVGISVLLLFQWIAMATQGWVLYGRGLVVLLFYLVKLIGYSYRCAIDPSFSFWPSFFGYTFGVGLCEELCKALPIVWYLRSDSNATWRTAFLVGLASGVGFGISEGLVYSSESYNGVASGGTYAVRFVSCVALHAIWAGTVGLLMYRNQDFVHGDFEFSDYVLFVFAYLGIPMVLHGLYDVFLKFDMTLAALGVAAASFGWMAWVIESSQSVFGEGTEAVA